MWEEKEFEEYLIKVGRVIKVVKGGRRFRFNALVAVGNKKGKVGIGMGKAKEVPEAIRKAVERAKRDMITVPLTEKATIPYQVIVRNGSGKVLLKPAPEGHGIIAGKAVRAVVEACGIKDVITKSLGSNNPHNLAHATIEALRVLRSPEEIFRNRYGEKHE
ncbi:MAG: 30S ribosomal protein S5 [Deltaproteobacteria bacterium]|jgi:small subunit ribosomal protein S5|nr:30S ribosomal protein S5 [Deltaproteobacteria bacterium]MCK4277833.1 30S ribosomal protein S5 [Desulfurellaceae bacterium]